MSGPLSFTLLVFGSMWPLCEQRQGTLVCVGRRLTTSTQEQCLGQPSPPPPPAPPPLTLGLVGSAISGTTVRYLDTWVSQSWVEISSGKEAELCRIPKVCSISQAPLVSLLKFEFLLLFWPHSIGCLWVLGLHYIMLPREAVAS